MDSSNMKNYNWPIDLQTKIQNFKDLLDNINDLDDKTKVLWIDIYCNAFSDRQLSQNMFDSLSSLVQEDSQNHAIYGDKLAKYIERLTKSNDQILKLAELIEKAKEKSKSDQEISVDDIYEKIGRRK